MIDDYFLTLLKSKAPLLTLHKNILLTEISYATPQLILEQLQPALLPKVTGLYWHILKDIFYHRNFDQYRRLREMGFILQVNLLSLTGYYGSGAKKAARFILEKDLAPLVGTDLHHHYHLGALTDPKNLSAIHRALGNKSFNNLDALSKQE